VYVVGYTFSTDFSGAMAGSLQSTNRGSGDAFLVKFFDGIVRLRAEVSGPKSVTLSWPADLTGFVLESTDQLAANSEWTGVVSEPVLAGTDFTVTLPAAAPQRFYRLKGPE